MLFKKIRFFLQNKKTSYSPPPSYSPPKELVRQIRCEYDGQIIKKYTILDVVKISIIEEKEHIYYCMDEPEYSDEATEIVFQDFLDEGKQEKPATVVPEVLEYYKKKILSGLGPIYPLINDYSLEEIALNGPFEKITVFHREIEYGWIETNIMVDEKTALQIAKTLSRMAGKPISPAYPLIEGILPIGHRVAVAWGKDVSRKGTSFVIRMKNKNPLSLPQLVGKRLLSPLMASYLWMLTELQGFLFIIGGMAAGKTTLMQALLNMLPDTHRIVTIEDTPELVLSTKNWDPLVTRQVFTKGGDAVDIGIYELSKFALRRRAEHLVIGEVRGEEARILAQAAATGHGSISTFHADSVKSALFRLMSEPISLKPGFIGLVWAFVHIKSISPGKRRVVKIIETIPKGPNKFSLSRIFRWVPETDSFEPSMPEEVVNKSYRLRIAMEALGIEKSDLAEELAERAEFILSLAKKDVNALQIREYISGFYKLKPFGFLKVKSFEK